jgi:hypothetical protein
VLTNTPKVRGWNANGTSLVALTAIIGHALQNGEDAQNQSTEQGKHRDSLFKFHIHIIIIIMIMPY